MNKALADAAERIQALDTTRSFIVQAPAGSGKTELLTRRVLTLLTTVDRPEEVLAITFTRKAAAEMRHRVVMALKRASDQAPVDDVYEQEGLELARRVLARDGDLGWQLIEDPERLGIRTIDSLATNLAHRLPVLSSLGAATGLVDDASALYQEAAERFIDQHISKIAAVSQKLDNRLETLRGLLVNLLAVRDQWVRYAVEDFTDDRLREVLEQMLCALLQSRVRALCASAPPGLGASLLPVVQGCAFYLRELKAVGALELESPHLAVLALADALEASGGQLPDSEVDEIGSWSLIADFLLTTSGTPRRKLTIKEGFPAQSADKQISASKSELKEHKATAEDMLRQLDGESTFTELLAEVRKLPEPHYRDEDWALLGQLGVGLQYLLAELQLVFAERREVDFLEISARALQSLGDDQTPTDLSLAMDLKIKHLLVDEFQDTSRAQFALFERLVAGWEPGDGRTFFAVGDPMQSIYRFREGDVGLFLQAVDEGIGPVDLQPLKLVVNFRSVPAVIDWVNARFSAAFPARSDRDIGAVTYEPSEPKPSERDKPDKGEIRMHVLERDATGGASVPDANAAAEAEQVASLVAASLAEDSQGTVGILLRARTHAPAIVSALQVRGIPFRAVELERLGDRPVVRDIVALVLALRYPHDRISWLSLLRGPLCGLVLSDLHALCADSHRESVIELAQQTARVALMSADGQKRLQGFLNEVLPAVHSAPRTRIVPWAEALWLRLGGPSVCVDDVDLDAAERALIRLAALEQNSGLWQRQAVAQAMESLYAGENPDPAAQRVQLMTLHKSKGLEFGTVILPSLGRQGRGDDRRLLDWYESTIDGRPSLLLAPIDAPGINDGQRSAIGRLLRRFRSRADEAERLRLLYVACTRAQRQLHLVATLACGDDGMAKAPASGSLLAPLWPQLSAEHGRLREPLSEPVADTGLATTRAANEPHLAEDDCSIQRAPFKRTVSDWAFPQLDAFVWQNTPPVKLAAVAIEYDWQGSTARDVGTAVHRELQRLADIPHAERAPPGSEDLGRIARQLRTLGVVEASLDDAVAQVAQALRNTLDDERGRWTLHSHKEARSEWALSVPHVHGKRVVSVERIIIDRTFVDTDGNRWIVDYKTGSHAGGGLDAFLDREVERYREQLETYARVMQRIDPEHAVRVGLWFPMVRGWREL